MGPGFQTFWNAYNFTLHKILFNFIPHVNVCNFLKIFIHFLALKSYEWTPYWELKLCLNWYPTWDFPIFNTFYPFSFLLDVYKRQCVWSLTKNIICDQGPPNRDKACNMTERWTSRSHTLDTREREGSPQQQQHANHKIATLQIRDHPSGAISRWKTTIYT